MSRMHKSFVVKCLQSFAVRNPFAEDEPLRVEPDSGSREAALLSPTALHRANPQAASNQNPLPNPNRKDRRFATYKPETTVLDRVGRDHRSAFELSLSCLPAWQ